MSDPKRSITRVTPSSVVHAVCVVCGSTPDYGHKKYCYVSTSEDSKARMDLSDGIQKLIGYAYWCDVTGVERDGDEGDDDEDGERAPLYEIMRGSAAGPLSDADKPDKIVKACAECFRQQIGETNPCHCYCGYEKWEPVECDSAFTSLQEWLTSDPAVSEESGDDDEDGGPDYRQEGIPLGDAGASLIEEAMTLRGSFTRPTKKVPSENDDEESDEDDDE